MTKEQRERAVKLTQEDFAYLNLVQSLANILATQKVDKQDLHNAIDLAAEIVSNQIRV